MNHDDRRDELLFSSPERVRDLLLDHIPEDWADKLSADSLERVAGSYIAEDSGCKDVLWRARIAEQWVYFYLVLAPQDDGDAFMAAWMMAGIGLLYQNLIDGGHISPNGKVPAVLPILICDNAQEWTAATSISDLIGDGPGSLTSRHGPRFKYMVIGRFG